MLYINKITSNTTVDFAAEELKKYLRMMMPEGGDVKIAYAPEAVDGIRLGLMQDLGLDVSDAEDVELDDILYIDMEEDGGIIAGDNTRSVLLSVYEYFRQMGCRWLMPGVDGEYIPMKDITPVKYRHKPSCRYRGWCIEGECDPTGLNAAIDFMPKVGMNAFMIQFENPKGFYDRYYAFESSTSYRGARADEPISEGQAMQWRRLLESEMSKRSIQLHDVGHGFTSRPFGLFEQTIEDSKLGDERRFLAEMNGKRGLLKDKPVITNFCMSNPEARRRVVEYITDYAEGHTNVDYLHVWLADGTNNHCECKECQRKTPSDFYMMLMNELDEALTERGLATRITFISYVDTTWAPTVERIKNPDRFSLLFAPIFRSFAESMPEERERTVIEPYKRNKNVFPPTLGASFDYLEEWKKVWKGAYLGFDYHFWRHQYYDLSGLMQARILSEDVRVYKKNGVDGILACGTQRCFFPTGLPFYVFARTMFDTELGYDELLEDYYYHAFGEDYRDFRDYLSSLYDALPFEYFSRDVARERENGHYAPEMADSIRRVRDITKKAREGLIKDHYNYDERVRTVSVRMLEFHADVCDAISDWMLEKALGNITEAERLYERVIEVGSRKIPEFELYFDSKLCFSEYYWTQKEKQINKDAVTI